MRKILQVIEVGFVGLSEGAAGLVCWDDKTNMALDIYRELDTTKEGNRESNCLRTNKRSQNKCAEEIRAGKLTFLVIAIGTFPSTFGPTRIYKWGANASSEVFNIDIGYTFAFCFLPHNLSAAR